MKKATAQRPVETSRDGSAESGWRPHLDENLSVPLYEQLVEQTALAISAGVLRPGDTLPSVRTLAAELRLNPNTTARAVREMGRLGLTRTLRGQGHVVDENAHAAAAPLAARSLERELEGVVRVARGLGMELEELQTALRKTWEG